MIVAKVGGSLYDLPDLGSRLQTWIARQNRAPIVLVPGGGSLVDDIRELDRVHHLGEEVCHDLALRALSINALLLKRLILGSIVVAAPVHRPDYVMVLDCWQYFNDLPKENDVPHSWHVTSDSLAGQVARNCNARELVLMKSTDLEPSDTWDEAARLGSVDAWFPQIASSLEIPIRTVNLRDC